MQQLTFIPTKPRSGNHRFRSAPKPAASREWWPVSVGSVVLAIDPSIVNCGFAVMLKTDGDPIRLRSGVIHPHGKPDEYSRFDDLAAQVAAAVRPIRFNGEVYVPSDAVIEIPSGGQRPGHSAYQLMHYARAVGVCEAACHFAGLSLNRVPVNEWKCGKTKRRTMVEVAAIFDFKGKDDNEIDAIALGWWLCTR